MAPIKKHDFVELEYTGKLKDTGMVFDTTSKDAAVKAGIHREKAEYRPVVLCVGEGHILKGLEENIVGKELGKHTVEVPAEKAFGKKNPKLLKLIPLSVFKKQNINPHVGLELNIDGVFGLIKSVSSGRVIVDFNHPLAGQDLVYDVEVKRLVNSDAEKVQGLIRLRLGMDAKVEVKEGSAFIKIDKDIPKQVQELLAKEIEKDVQIKKVEFRQQDSGKEKQKK